MVTASPIYPLAADTSYGGILNPLCGYLMISSLYLIALCSSPPMPVASFIFLSMLYIALIYSHLQIAYVYYALTSVLHLSEALTPYNVLLCESIF